jgi:hypothetical protein
MAKCKHPCSWEPHLCLGHIAFNVPVAKRWLDGVFRLVNEQRSEGFDPFRLQKTHQVYVQPTTLVTTTPRGLPKIYPIGQPEKRKRTDDSVPKGPKFDEKLSTSSDKALNERSINDQTGNNITKPLYTEETLGIDFLNKSVIFSGSVKVPEVKNRKSGSKVDSKKTADNQRKVIFESSTAKGSSNSKPPKTKPPAKGTENTTPGPSTADVDNSKPSAMEH